MHETRKIVCVSRSVTSNSFVTPWTVQPARLFCPWDFPGKDTGVGCHFPSPGDLPDPGIELGSPALQADALLSELLVSRSLQNVSSYILCD